MPIPYKSLKEGLEEANLINKLKKSDEDGGLIKHFSNMTDPRVDRSKWHLLIDIIVIGICAVYDFLVLND